MLDERSYYSRNRISVIELCTVFFFALKFDDILWCLEHPVKELEQVHPLAPNDIAKVIF